VCNSHLYIWEKMAPRGHPARDPHSRKRIAEMGCERRPRALAPGPGHNTHGGMELRLDLPCRAVDNVRFTDIINPIFV
jgi:hypothetical protein